MSKHLNIFMKGRISENFALQTVALLALGEKLEAEKSSIIFSCSHFLTPSKYVLSL